MNTETHNSSFITTDSQKLGIFFFFRSFDKILQLFYHIGAAAIKWCALMQFGRLDFQYAVLSIAGATSCLFGDESHRIAFI